MKKILLIFVAMALLLVTGCGSSSPSSPTNLTLTAAYTLSWSSVSGATSYNIYRGTTSGSTTFLGNVATTTFTDSSAVSGTTYYYQVTAVTSGQGESARSSAVNSNSAPPTGVTTTAGDGQASLSWTAVTNAASYNIYWSTTSGVTPSNGTKLTGVTNPYTQTGLTDGTAYYYVVTAVITGYGETNPSTQATCTPALQVSNAPSAVTVTPADGQVTIAWQAVSNATSYNIYWQTSSGVTTTTGTKIAGASNPYTLSGLTDGTPCYCVVTAVNSKGESVASSQMSAIPSATPAPAAPTQVSVTSGATQATLAWPAVPGATSYNIYWSTTSGESTSGTKITGVTNPYTQTGLTNSTTYYYVVTAKNANGESTASPQVSALPLIAIPATPTGVTATAGNGQISYTWTAVSGATSYELYVSTTTGVTPANGYAESSSSNAFILTGLTNGTPYYAVVTAKNSSGASSASSQVSATPVATAASSTSPVVTATPGDKQVTISWTTVSNASSYNIYWSTSPGVTTANGTEISGVNNAYTLTGLTDGTTYYFIVTAVVANSGETAASPQASAVPAASPAPAAPPLVTATPGVGQVSISWTPVSGATSYNVYYSTSTGVTPSNGTESASFTNGAALTLSSGKTYYIVVTSVNSNGESTASPVAMATPQ